MTQKIIRYALTGAICGWAFSETHSWAVLIFMVLMSIANELNFRWVSRNSKNIDDIITDYITLRRRFERLKDRVRRTS